MSYYEPQAWQAPARQASWEQPPPPSRSGASSTSQRDDSSAFASQFEEVDRAIDNLVKSGKFFLPGARRDPLPMGGVVSPRHYADHEPRMHGGRHSISEFDPSRSHSASNLQNFYASQRYQSRPNEAEQMMQAKRRMAAQRERELRNYHQEQQYNRSVLAEMSSNKSDRSMSPSTLSEEGRRELIARQHRALYGNDGTAGGFAPQSGYSDDGNTPRDPSSGVPTSSAGGMRGNSPRGMDPFGMGTSGTQGGTTDNSAQDNSAASQESGRGNNAASPATGTAPGNFTSFESASQQANKPSTSPTGGESPTRQVTKATTAPIGSGMGPIGSRPPPQQQQQQQQQPQQSGQSQGLNKRTTSPLPSSLNYNFGSNEPNNNSNNNNNNNNNERAGSSNSNNNAPKENANQSMGAWGTGSGVWGSNKIGATSVWG